MRTFYFVLMVTLAFLAAVALPMALTGQLQFPHHWPPCRWSRDQTVASGTTN